MMRLLLVLIVCSMGEFALSQVRYEFAGQLQGGAALNGMDVLTEVTFPQPEVPTSIQSNRIDYNNLIGALSVDGDGRTVNDTFAIFRAEPNIDVMDFGYRTNEGTYIFSMRFDEGANEDVPPIPDFNGFPVNNATLAGDGVDAIYNVANPLLNVVPAILHWSGDSLVNNRDFGDVANWVDSTGRPAIAIPMAGTDVVLDRQFLNGAEVGSDPDPNFLFDEVVFFDLPNESSIRSLVVDSHVILSATNQEAQLSVSDDVVLTFPGDRNGYLRLEYASLQVVDDVFVEPGSLFLMLASQIRADELVVERGRAHISTNSQATFRRVQLGLGSDFRVLEGARTTVDEPIIAGGDFVVVTGSLEVPTLTMSPTTWLAGHSMTNLDEPNIVGDVVVQGRITPGTPRSNRITAPFSIDGDYTQTETSRLEIDLRSTEPAQPPTLSLEPDGLNGIWTRDGDGGHDVLAIDGDVSLAGSLELTIGPDFDLERGMEFVFMPIRGTREGTFTDLAEGNIAMIDEGSGLELAVTYRGGDGNDVGVFVPDLGDFDGSRVLDVADVDLLSQAIGTDELRFDITADALVDLEDHRFWVEDLRGTFLGDTNLDGEVSFRDFLNLAQNFGRESASWGMGDFNGDGTVQFTDFLALAQNFGAVSENFLPVPEPNPSPCILFVVITLLIRSGLPHSRLA